MRPTGAAMGDALVTNWSTKTASGREIRLPLTLWDDGENGANERPDGPCGGCGRRRAAPDPRLACGQHYLFAIHGGPRCGWSMGGIGGTPDQDAGGLRSGQRKILFLPFFRFAGGHQHSGTFGVGLRAWQAGPGLRFDIRNS